MRLTPTTFRLGATRILLAAALPVLAAGASARAAAVPADDAALADRIEALAGATFPAEVPTGAERPFVFAQQAALFQASMALDPSAVRYARKRAEALADGDADTKEQGLALTAVLAIQPGDEFTWNKLLDLHVFNDYQNASDRIAYLKNLEANPGLPRAVVAHAGSRHAQILFDQGKEQAARNLLKSVLVANPLDIDALRLQYRLLPATATPFEREQALLNILRSNPFQPAYARLAARVAADQGLMQEAIPFYALAFNTSLALRRPDLQSALEWYAELYLADQRVDAYRNVRSLLDQVPNNLDAWYLDLLVVRSGGFQKAQQDKDLQRATVVMSDRVAELINAAIDAGGATTRPATTKPARATTRPFDAEGPFPLPDVASAVPLFAGDAVSPQLRQEFVEAVADLARLEIYFAHKPELAAPMLDALAQLQPAGDPLLTQLRGLSSLVSGDAKSALATLAGIAKDDPIAAMGLILAQLKDDPKSTEKPELEARALIQSHPDGLVGAFLVEALAGPRVKLIPKNGMEQLQQLIQSYPNDLNAVGTNPARIYSIHVEPVDTARVWGQPLLARVTLFNFSSVDLTIGDEGVIHPGLMFQLAPIIGAQPQAFPAFDTIAGPVVLHPRIPLTQIVRVDSPALVSVIGKTVQLAFTIDGQAATNVDTGLGGYAARFDKPFARAAVNDKAVNDAIATLNGGGVNPATPVDKFNAIGVLLAYASDAQNGQNPSPAVAAQLSAAAAAIKQAHTDPSPKSAAVAAWADQAIFALSDAGGRNAVLTEMAISTDWRRRLLALILLNAISDPAEQQNVIGKLIADPQPAVATYAKASAELLKLGKFGPQPTTRPTTRP